MHISLTVYFNSVPFHFTVKMQNKFGRPQTPKKWAAEVMKNPLWEEKHWNGGEKTAPWWADISRGIRVLRGAHPPLAGQCGSWDKINRNRNAMINLAILYLLYLIPILYLYNFNLYLVYRTYVHGLTTNPKWIVTYLTCSVVCSMTLICTVLHVALDKSVC